MRTMEADKKKGFTLLELLVVIAIIGLLSGVVMISIGKARMRARDAKRVQDLRQIRAAIESYANDHGKYPPPPPFSSFASSADPAKWNYLQNLLKPYLPQLPKDPVNNAIETYRTGNYSYLYLVNGMEYDLITQFEDKNNKNRCELKCWRRHSLRVAEKPTWCQGDPLCAPPRGGYSPYIYADH